MRWNIIVKCVAEDGKQDAITLGTIEPTRREYHSGKTWESICRNRSRFCS